MNIKKSLNRPGLDGFKASEGWLDKWKLSHGIKEKQISASEITNKIDVLQAIERVANAWEEVTVEKIKNCFAKCGFNKESCEIEDDIVNDEFKELFKELTESEITAEEYIDVEMCTSVFEINSDKVGWRANSVENKLVNISGKNLE
eukprot:gene468-10143_t